jgi:preprotein translocase subunit SecG
MASFLIGLFTAILVLTSLFIILVVLLQRGANEGMGTAFGGGAVESALGGDTNRVLTKTTIVASVIFFVVGLGLYMGNLALHKEARATVAMENVLKNAEEDSAAKKAVTEPAKPLQPGEATAEATKLLNEQASLTEAAVQSSKAPTAPATEAPSPATQK